LAHDQRGRHEVSGDPRRSAASSKTSACAHRPDRVRLKASIPGPYTLAGRIAPSGDCRPLCGTEHCCPSCGPSWELVAAGCEIVTVDEPSMS
jgi:5-methyltetrahydropteroyltriglutamate--homocysteine methyltransferase